jgi:cytochrome b involved in lipid metabolism
VYDVTEWINFHPGGRDILISMAGKDATEHFNEIGHSEYARGKMSACLLGKVSDNVRYNASEYQERPGEV